MRRLTAPILGLLALVAFAVPAAGQTGVEVRLADARLAPDGGTRLIVGVDGLAGTVLDASAFTVLEDGQPVGPVDVEPPGITGDLPVVVALAFDISGSVEPVFGEIQAAARGFVEAVTAAGVEVALIPFSSAVNVTVPPTSDAGALMAGIDALAPEGRTLLYDAIVTSGAALEARLAGEDVRIAHVVVFSDGADNGSAATIDDAILAAQSLEAPITTVGWEADDFDPAAMARLAEATGGAVVSSEDASDVAALFAGVAADIVSLYTVTYHSAIDAPAELPVTVIVDTPQGQARVDSLAINVRDASVAAPPTALPASRPPSPLVPFLANDVGLWVGLATAFLGAMIVLWFLFVRPVRSAGARSLEFGLSRYRAQRDREHELELPTANLTERAVELIGRLPKPKGFEEKLQLKLDRAAWLMRANEFVVLVTGSGLLGALLAYAATRHPLFALVGALLGAFVPIGVLNVRIDRRKRKFEDQLPSTMQLIAGSMRAGYGLLQAIDTVVQEGDDPTSTEFGRVLTEARLGMALEDALEAMAERMDSDDFRWVVLAINIQREVGGNLAELLTTIAATMRSRSQLRRQIKVLSAEGRISAWVVGSMPMVVTAVLLIIEPTYLAELPGRLLGLVMLGMGVGLFLLGLLWLRKIVNIEV